MNKVSEEKLDTRNTWGFGGSVYTRTKYDNGIVTNVGTTYYRHHSPQKFKRVFISVELPNDGIRLIDLGLDSMAQLIRANAKNAYIYRRDNAFFASLKDRGETTEHCGNEYTKYKTIPLAP